MAYNWQTGVGGAMTGAAAGQALIPIPGVGAAIGGILGLASGFMGDTPAPENINPYTASTMAALGRQQGLAQGQLQDALAGQRGMFGQAQNYFDELGRFEAQASYDPQQYFQDFLSQTGALEQLAKRNLTPFGDAEQRSADLAARATQDVASQFSGAGALQSGAALQAMSQGAGEARAQYDDALNRQYQAQLGNMLAQAQGQALASRQAEFAGAQQADQQRLAAIQGAGAGYAGLGQTYAGQANALNSVIGNLLGAQAGLSGAEYYAAPQQPGGEAILQGALTGANILASSGMFDQSSKVATQEAANAAKRVATGGTNVSGGAKPNYSFSGQGAGPPRYMPQTSPFATPQNQMFDYWTNQTSLPYFNYPR